MEEERLHTFDFIVGTTGSGKTTLVKEQVKAYLMAYGHIGKVLYVISDLKELSGSLAGVPQLSHKDIRKEDFTFVNGKRKPKPDAKYHWKGERWFFSTKNPIDFVDKHISDYTFLVCDDGKSTIFTDRISKNTEDFFSRHRHSHCDILGIVHSPDFIPRKAIPFIKSITFFKTLQLLKTKKNDFPDADKIIEKQLFVNAISKEAQKGEKGKFKQDYHKYRWFCDTLVRDSVIIQKTLNTV